MPNKNSDTNSDLIAKAIEALSSSEYKNEVTPTSVKVSDDSAKIWFEFDGDDIIGKWEYCLHVPVYYFWGRKKREKYWKDYRNRVKEKLQRIKKYECNGVILAEWEKYEDSDHYVGRVFKNGICYGFFVKDELELIQKILQHYPINATKEWSGKNDYAAYRENYKVRELKDKDDKEYFEVTSKDYKGGKGYKATALNKNSVESTIKSSYWGRTNQRAFQLDDGRYVIIVPQTFDHSRMARLGGLINSIIDSGYVAYSGSRYGADKNSHAFVFESKKAWNLYCQQLVSWN